MLRWMCGKTYTDRIPNNIISAQLIVVPIEKKMKEHALRQFGNAQRRPLEGVLKSYIVLFFQYIKRGCDRLKRTWIEIIRKI